MMTMHNVSNCQVPMKVCKCMARCKLNYQKIKIFNYPWKYIHIECALF
jgi:hypothetical protein